MDDEIMELILQARRDLELGHDNSDSGTTLAQVMENIRTQPYEISALFDPCGRKICEHTSRHQKFDVLAIPTAYLPSTFVSVHNHVSDITFSGLDLNTAVDMDLQMLVVVSPTRNYFMMRPSTGWPDANLSAEYRDITQILLHHRFYDYDRATARHLALMKVAAHYGIRYYVTDLNHQVVASTAVS